MRHGSPREGAGGRALRPWDAGPKQAWQIRSALAGQPIAAGRPLRLCFSRKPASDAGLALQSGPLSAFGARPARNVALA